MLTWRTFSRVSFVNDIYNIILHVTKKKKGLHMMKNILMITLVALLSVAPSLQAKAEPMIEISDNMDNDILDITISLEQSQLRVTGASGQMLQVYNVAGVCIMSVRVDGDDRHYDLNLTKGCYIVKVGKVVRKISIR